MRRYLLLLPLAFLAVGCAGELRGTAFLDENGNKMLDTLEKGVPRALFVVRKDGALTTSGVTDAQGKFSVKLTDAGNYCIEIDKSVSRLNVKPAWTSKSVETPPQGDQAGQPTTTPETPATKPATGDSSSTQTQHDVVTQDNLKGCGVATGFNLDVDVPISKDFEGSIAKLPQDVELPIRYGEQLDVNIFYPFSCPLQTLYLPNEIVLAQGFGSSLYDVNVNRLRFSESHQTSNMIAPALTVTEDPIGVEHLKVQLKEGLTNPPSSVVITPTVICPDGSSPPIPKMTLKILSVDPVSVRQSVTSPNATTKQVIVKVENLTGGAFQTIQLVVEPPPASNINLHMVGNTFGADECDDMGNKYNCFGPLTPHEVKTFTYSFTLPAAPAAPVTYTGSAKIILKDTNQTIEAENIVIPVGD